LRNKTSSNSGAEGFDTGQIVRTAQHGGNGDDEDVDELVPALARVTGIF
jgi:hypothetical protein